MIIRFRLWSILLGMLLNVSVFCQNKFFFDSANIEVKPLNINTTESEFSPFIIGTDFYFTSSKERKIGITQMEISSQHQLLDIYKGFLSDSITISNVKALSEKINNSVNQGSCFFDLETSTLYYSGDVLAESHYKKYKLAIFSSEFKDNEFQYPKIEIILADTFSASHPMLYKGKLYFSSNLTGGKGKTDIYYAEKIDNQWLNIKNCAYLNTTEHEFYPYVINENEIYFSSNRAGGYGNLDIYKCTIVDTTYIIQNLGTPINSKFDDFGVYIDSTQESGYFSSNRRKEQDDIYFFKQTWPVFKNCKEPVIEDYCYNLTEESTLDSDSLKGYYYQWSFGDGKTEKGLSVRHCFPGPASYLINLNIIDSVTRAVFMSQATFDLKVDSIVQLKVNCLDTVLQNKRFNINTDWTYLPNNKINDYYFEVDGKRIRGKSHDIKFSEKGKHKVLLGVTSFNLKTKQKELLCTTKEIICVDSATWLEVEKREIQKITDQYAFKKFIGDSSFLNTMNYSDEEMKFTKKGLNGALAVNQIKKTINNDSKQEIIAINLKKKEYNSENINSSNQSSINKAEAKDLSDPNYLNLIKHTLINLKEDENIRFKVHLGKSKTIKDTTILNAKGINGIDEKIIDNEYHYTYGNEKKLKDIEKYYDKIIKAGIENPLIAGYKNDTLIAIQQNFLKSVDFDKTKSKEDSLRIDKNIAAKNYLNNNFNVATIIQLRTKANELLTVATEIDEKVLTKKTESSVESGIKRDSLITIAAALEAESLTLKLQAIDLIQKANELDYKNNTVILNQLLTSLKNSKSDFTQEAIVKNTEIINLKIESDKLKLEALNLPENTEKLSLLKNSEERQSQVLLKQNLLITELKNFNSNQISVNDSKNNTPTKNETTLIILTQKGEDNQSNKNIEILKNGKDAANLINSKTIVNNTAFSEYGFIPVTKIQKTTMELLEEFGDVEVKDLEFKVQVGVFKKRKIYHFPKLKGLGKVSTESLNDGTTRMTMGGSYPTLRQAVKHNIRIVEAGQNDAFVSVYFKGERIGIENLKRKGVLVKTQVVLDSVSETQLTINASNLVEYAQLDFNENSNTSPNNEQELIDNGENELTNQTTNLNSVGTASDENFVFVPRTNIQKKTVFYAQKYGNISADGLEFKVQIAIFKYRSSYSFPKLKDLGKIETEKAEEGGTRMTIGGSFKTLNEALDFNKKVAKAGQTDAFVSVYYQAKRIYIENLEKRGIFTSSATVNKID